MYTHAILGMQKCRLRTIPSKLWWCSIKYRTMTKTDHTSTDQREEEEEEEGSLLSIKEALHERQEAFCGLFRPLLNRRLLSFGICAVTLCTVFKLQASPH